jgi:hypothetical protein
VGNGIFCSVYVHATVNADDRSANDDVAFVIAIPVVVTSLVAVTVAAIFFCLSRRHTAIAPTGFASLTPPGRTVIASEGLVFPAVATLPTAIIISVAAAAMLFTHGLIMRIALAVAFVLPLRHGRGGKRQPQHHCP